MRVLQSINQSIVVKEKWVKKKFKWLVFTIITKSFVVGKQG